jgi:hypothetical protein
MLDIRAVAYIAPVSEVDFAPVPLTVRLVNYADETGLVSAGFRIYNGSYGLLIYQSDIIPVEIAKGASADVSALTDFMPPAPADDTYFVLFDGNAANALVPDGIDIHLGSFYFDVKPAPLGPIPAGHAVTHEDTGIDEVDVTGLAGLLADPQTPILHHLEHETGGSDEVDVTGLAGQLADDQPALAHDIAGARHTSTATPGQTLQADANGLPVDATNTDADVSDAVDKRNCRAVGEASNATPTPDADTTDLYFLSALAEAAAFAVPAGTPVDGQKLIIRILDNAAPRVLSWNAGAGGYIAHGATLPLITITSKFLYIGLIFSTTVGKWCCVATSQEA